MERCEYEIQFTGNRIELIVKCKSCDGKASLLERECRNGVFDVLLEEPVPDTIILSGFVETLYEDDALALVQRMTDMLRTIKGFCRRKTGEDSERCLKCKKGPAYVFKKIEKAFRKSLPAFRRETELQSSGLSARQDSCKSCIELTRSDLQSLSNEMSELRSFILRGAFRISVSET